AAHAPQRQQEQRDTSHFSSDAGFSSASSAAPSFATPTFSGHKRKQLSQIPEEEASQEADLLPPMRTPVHSLLPPLHPPSASPPAVVSLAATTVSTPLPSSTGPPVAPNSTSSMPSLCTPSPSSLLPPSPSPPSS